MPARRASELLEGQFQGGAVQVSLGAQRGYIYGKDAGCRMPASSITASVCSDLPMIDTVILEIPNPGTVMACAASARRRSSRARRDRECVSAAAACASPACDVAAEDLRAGGTRE